MIFFFLMFNLWVVLIILLFVIEMCFNKLFLIVYDVVIGLFNFLILLILCKIILLYNKFLFNNG